MDTTRIPVGNHHVAVHHQPPSHSAGNGGRAVLFIHGATFPSSLAMFWRFDGVSWADTLNRAGFHVFGLDFLGFGASDRPQTLSRARDVQDEIAAAVRHARERTGVERINLIAHSWGTMPAALFATEHAALIDRLALFAAITARSGGGIATPPQTGYTVSADDQWTRFSGYVPKGEPLLITRESFDPWAEAYLASDPHSAVRVPPSVLVAPGPIIDLAAAAVGTLPYRPADITVPTLLVRGEWDFWPTDSDARWLMGALENAPVKRDAKLPQGTHVMHLERNRHALFEEVERFLAAD